MTEPGKRAWFVVAARVTVVLGFLLGMPILALPGVPGAVRLRLLARHAAPVDSATNQRDSDEREPALSMVTEQENPGSTLEQSPIDELKQQLIELGATYMRLERVGVDGDRYHFRCDLPVAEGSSYTQRIEVAGEDPAELMSSAVEQAKSWQQRGGASQGALSRPAVRLR